MVHVEMSQQNPLNNYDSLIKMFFKKSSSAEISFKQR
jgi:hypothetical protein